MRTARLVGLLTRLPNNDRLSLEADLSAIPFQGVGFGPALNNLLHLCLKGTVGTASLGVLGREAVGAAKTLARVLVRGSQDRLTPFVEANRGRVAFTSVSPIRHYRGLLAATVEEMDPQEVCIFGAVGHPLPDLAETVGYVDRRDVPSAMDWRTAAELGRVALRWRAILAAFCRSHGLPSQVALRALNILTTSAERYVAYCAMLDRLHPSAVVTEFDRMAAAVPLVLAAQHLGIPTLTFQHGILGVGYVPLVADRVMTWGGESCETLIGYGVPPERIILTGWPAMESPTPQDVEAARRRLGLGPGKVVVLATSAIGKERGRLVEMFCDALGPLDGVEPVVKLHPAETLADYAPQVERYPAVQFVTTADATKDETLALADIVVCRWSGYGLEAMLWETPVVVLDVFRGALGSASKWIEAGASPGATTEVELCDAVSRLLHDCAFRDATLANTRTFIRSVYAATGQEAARNVAEVIRATRLARP